MNLREMWKKYENEKEFNLSVLPDFITSQGIEIKYQPNSSIVTRGDFPRYIYFIKSGSALGTRSYENGNVYDYFQINESNGSIGLLEIMARKDSYIATIVAISEVHVLRIEAAAVYDFIMSNNEMLHRCITLVSQDLYKRSGNDGILYYLDGVNRVRFYLANYYEMNKNNDEDVLVEPQYQTIANNIGVNIRTVVRSIKILKDLNEISSVKKRIMISKEQHKKLLKNLEDMKVFL